MKPKEHKNTHKTMGQQQQPHAKRKLAKLAK
jgi:hypothetical protein